VLSQVAYRVLPAENDETTPGRPGILLTHDPQSSEDGIRQMDEMMRLKMNADLVTLSACSTGLGKFVNGEGVLGLTRAFFYAAARNVAVNLWNVNDPATATLMGNFYRNLNRGLPKGEAMRRAKLAMLRGSQASWRHPYYWAAFVMEGEGRALRPLQKKEIRNSRLRLGPYLPRFTSTRTVSKKFT
jgi:CHAT domain-containing protein